MHGPHDSDDFITAAGRQTIYSSEWTVDYNCNRTGIRLDGPKIEWAREHGEEGGSHPSNVVDYPYPSPGGVNWTGDSPVIFPQDAPGLGGFVCSSTVVSADMWKLGKLKPGDKTTLTPISYKSARELAERKAKFLSIVQAHISSGIFEHKSPLSLLEIKEVVSETDVIVEVIPSSSTTGPKLTLRQVRYPPPTLTPRMLILPSLLGRRSLYPHQCRFDLSESRSRYFSRLKQPSQGYSNHQHTRYIRARKHQL